jgi:hypothetical protein
MAVVRDRYLSQHRPTMKHNTRNHATRPARPQRPGNATATPAAPPSPARDCPSWEDLLGQR